MILIYFVYGLAFFSMGLAILLEIGRAPLLAEARVLRPLAVFGFLHGIHEWLEIVIQENIEFEFVLPAYMRWIRLGLLAVSFISLMAYGIQVIYPPRKLAAMDAWVGAGVLTLYGAILVLVGSNNWDDIHQWISQADVLARYLIAIPGAILAAFALITQAREKVTIGQIKLSNSLRVAAYGFILYGISQVFVPPVNFFPARSLNADLFFQVAGIPIQGVRAVIAVVITTSLIRAMQIVENQRQGKLLQAQKDRLEALEQVQQELLKREDLRRELMRHTVIAQEEERSRISRELHDETAQILTAFSLDVATLQSRTCEDPEVAEASSRLQSLSRNLSNSLKSIVHDLRPALLDDLGLIPAIHHLIDDNKKHADIKINFEITGTQRRFDPLIETVLYRVIQESLTNIVKHAEVKEADLFLIFDQDKIAVKIDDHGVGFDVRERHPTQIGWGIAGMRERVLSIGGEFKITSSPGKGTGINAIVPQCVILPKEGEE